MNESMTPRTDANLKVLHPGVQPSTWYVQAEFARQLERDLTAALARAEKAEAELERMRKELDSIVELNQGQFLQLEYLRRIYVAADILYAESEEYDFDDGMGRGAPQDLWDALSDAFEPETDAIKRELDAAIEQEKKHA